jgi:hypothetical protein
MSMFAFNSGIEDYVILHGGVLERLRDLPDGSVQTCVTSPPYFGLRSYLPADHPDKAHEIGTEKTPDEYVAKIVAVFREVWRVLRDDGTAWLNLGDSYAGKSGGRQGSGGDRASRTFTGTMPGKKTGDGLKDKDLIGVPWRVAFALQADGWFLRQDIIWHKPNPMPESVRDRCTKAHEYIFMLTKKAKYYYDHEAIKNPPSPELIKQVEEGYNGKDTKDFKTSGAHALSRDEQMSLGSNKRSVWTVPPETVQGRPLRRLPARPDRALHPRRGARGRGRPRPVRRQRHDRHGRAQARPAVRRR